MNDQARTFPVMYDVLPKGPARIPWALAERAYARYSEQYGTGQSLQRMAERGGFWATELDEYVPGWREEAREGAKP